MSNVVAIDVEMVGTGPNGMSYDTARQQVINLINSRILVGHDLQRDLGVFHLTHNNTRDTATYPPLVQRYGRGQIQKPKLRELAEAELNCTMSYNHDPVEDARMAMAVYMKYQW
ncbi:hypothetical protein B566_EDAN011324 [Ephemera danica]|nr:hypothetical protein B566_EDAN011324 [Ephemera danica]